MRKRLFLLLLWNVITSLLNASSFNAADSSLLRLYFLSGKNLNYSSPIPESQILELCKKTEKQLIDANNYDDLFRVQLIYVNSLCLKGDIGLAVNKAQEMYEKARELDSAIGRVLAVQAIGTTFMHSNENQQAYKSFAEAEALMKDMDSDLKIRLAMQQLHVCMLMKDMERLQQHLVAVHDLLDNATMPYKEDYIFYLQCYQTYYDIGIKYISDAEQDLDLVRKMRPVDGVLDRWYYNLASCYYELAGDYVKSLLYCDSTAMAVKKGQNVNEYKYVLIDKAGLLEKNSEIKEAVVLYDSITKLSDSLNSIRYVQQADSLRMIYWVDQMEIENAAKDNKMLAWGILSVFVVLIVAVILIIIALKENKRLILSRKKLEEVRQETAASIQSKNLFLSNMSHELRTPLNAIVGFAGLLTSNEIDDVEMRRQSSKLIKQNSELLLKLFNDVADLSALKGDNIHFSFEDYDAVSLCTNVIDTVEKVKQTYARVYFETSLDKLMLYTDSGRLQQVLINLLINATKFTKEGKITLKLDLNKEANEAIFTIEDTGCGIPLEKQPHIFERFEKLHENVQGAGLGLSICQLIIEHVGGRIWIDSSYTEGARFIFTHPLDNKSNQTLV